MHTVIRGDLKSGLLFLLEPICFLIKFVIAMVTLLTNNMAKGHWLLCEFEGVSVCRDCRHPSAESSGADKDEVET